MLGSTTLKVKVYSLKVVYSYNLVAIVNENALRKILLLIIKIDKGYSWIKISMRGENNFTKKQN